jgi:hypothetical protein
MIQSLDDAWESYLAVGVNDVDDSGRADRMRRSARYAKNKPRQGQ